MLSYRRATKNDTLLYYNWVNDSNVRKQSFNSNSINFEDHKRWFKSKLKDTDCLMLVFKNENNLDIGQVRIQKEDGKSALIGISIASELRGKGYAREMIQISSDCFFIYNPIFIIKAFIKIENSISKYVFEKAGFEFNSELMFENTESILYTKDLK